MTRIAVVYHSGFGHTKAIAEHVVRGAAGVGPRSITTGPGPLDRHRVPTCQCDSGHGIHGASPLQ